MAASTDVAVYAIVYRDSEVKDAFIRVTVDQDADVIDLGEAFAAKVKVESYEVVLWKPLQFLPRNGQADLRSRLSNHKHDLSKFCIDLRDDDWPDKTVSELFTSNTSHPRASKVTSLVVQINSKKATVVAQQEVLDGSEGDEQGDVVTAMIKQFIRSRNQVRDSPSQSAKPTNYVKHQNGSAPILDGRYGDHPTSLAPPIEIYHPAFAAFVGYSLDESLPLPEDVVAATSQFMDVVSQIATLEQDRPSTRSHLVRLLNIVVDQNANKNKTIADHYVTYDRETQPLVKAALAIIEEKAELGQSAEPSVQGEFSYVHYWTQDDRSELFDACFCPSFVLSIAGPWFSVCGAIHTTHPVVHRLSSFEWLGQSRVIDDKRVYHLARIFHALRLAIGQLKEWYKTLVVPDVRDGPMPVRFYPLATKCTLCTGEVLNFRYVEPLKGSEPECVTFLASDCSADARLFVVKFVERYGEDAHRLLAKHGYAPKLLYCGPVWPGDLEQSGVGPRKMVIMAFIKGKTTVKKYTDGKLPKGVLDAVEAALDLLHRHDKKMVHGDIREPNIMVEDGDSDGNEKERTKIVDFDWSGIEGEVRYPLHLSDSIQWPAGVEIYKLIQASHDREMLTKLKRRMK